MDTALALHKRVSWAMQPEFLGQKHIYMLVRLLGSVSRHLRIVLAYSSIC